MALKHSGKSEESTESNRGNYDRRLANIVPMGWSLNKFLGARPKGPPSRLTHCASDDPRDAQ